MTKAADLHLLEKRSYADASGNKLLYRLLKPEDYQPRNQYPLVLFLHGMGERGDDNDKQLAHGVPEFLKPKTRKQYPCFLVAPQCPVKDKWALVDGNAAFHVQPEKLTQPARLALEVIAALQKEFSIDPGRFYITGLSMGGIGTWDIIARRPDLFAAAVIVCGAADEKTAVRIAKMPIWVFHGALDDVVRPSCSRHMVAALKKAGGAPRFTEYSDVGHNSWEPAYKDPRMMEWLFAQRKD